MGMGNANMTHIDTLLESEQASRYPILRHIPMFYVSYIGFNVTIVSSGTKINISYAYGLKCKYIMIKGSHSRSYTEAEFQFKSNNLFGILLISNIPFLLPSLALPKVRNIHRSSPHFMSSIHCSSGRLGADHGGGTGIFQETLGLTVQFCNMILKVSHGNVGIWSTQLAGPGPSAVSQPRAVRTA